MGYVRVCVVGRVGTNRLTMFVSVKRTVGAPKPSTYHRLLRSQSTVVGTPIWFGHITIRFSLSCCLRLKFIVHWTTHIQTYTRYTTER